MKHFLNVLNDLNVLLWHGLYFWNICKRPGLNLIRKSLSGHGQIRSYICATPHQIGMLLYFLFIYMLLRVVLFEVILCRVCRVEQTHGNLKRILQTSMGDLCTCWDAINNLLVLQHNEIKTSFKMSLHVVTHTFNSSFYKRLLGAVSKYALMHIAEEFNKVKVIGFDKKKCGCVLRQTQGFTVCMSTSKIFCWCDTLSACAMG